MYYIKCGVNSSLHNSGCCIRSVAPWITVLSRHTVFTKRVIYYKFTFVWYSTKQGTTHRPTSLLARHVPFLWPQERPRKAERSGSLAIVCYGDFCWDLLLLLFFLLFFFLKLVFNIAYTTNSEEVSATRISLMASSSSFIFSQPCLWDVQASALFILYMTGQSCRNIIPL